MLGYKFCCILPKISLPIIREFSLKALLTLNVADKLFANPKRIRLLQKIDETGSLSQGAKLAGISYKSAWDAVHAMNQELSAPVVHSEKGGKGGGGAELTHFGRRLLKVYEITGTVQNMALKALLDESVPMNSMLDVMAHFSLKTSARNQLTGMITSIESRGLNDIISVKLSSQQAVNISITHTSCKNLNLQLNQSILLLLKAPAITISKVILNNEGKNCIKGKLINIEALSDVVELTLDINGNDIMYAVMETHSFQETQLSLNDECFACFDISQAIIASMDEYAK